MIPQEKTQIAQAVLGALGAIAPEADLRTVDPNTPIREQLDLDSMDFLNFLVAVHESLGVDIPERDYAKLGTLEAIVDYVAQRRAA